MTARKLRTWPAYRITIATPDDVAKLLHESIACGFVRSGDGSPAGYRIVIRRRDLPVPSGVEPVRINGDCARRFAVVSLDPPHVVEVAPEDVVPFVDVAKLIAEATERANRAQATNRPLTEDDVKDALRAGAEERRAAEVPLLKRRRK